MQFETFDHLFKFRPKCPCGSKIETYFTNHNQYQINLSESGSELLLDMKIRGLDDVSSLNIISYISSPYFSAKAKYLDNSKKVRIQAIEFSKAHFTKAHQEKMGIRVKMSCSNLHNWENCGYSLATNPIIFNFGKNWNCSNGQILPITLEEENYYVPSYGEEAYKVHNNFNTNNTVINFTGSKSFNKPILEVKAAREFLKFSLDREHILRKIKTLALLS